MRNSPKPASANAANSGYAASAPPFCTRILHCKRRGCGLLAGWLAVACLSIACLGNPAKAQDERPQITPVNRNAPKKKTSSPRALALLQLGADGKSTLVPIAILINGKFWDAASYKADPVPMALEGGSVYEVERTGTSLGLFTVGAALHSNAVNVVSPWLGTGQWVPAGSEGSNKALQAEAVPAGMDTGEQAPRLTRDPAKVNTPPDSASTSASSNGAKSSAPSSSGPSSSGPTSSSDDDRPRITRGTTAPAPEKAPSDPPKTSSGSVPPPAGSKPGDSKPSDSKPNGSDADKSASAKPEKPAANIPASDSGAGIGSRPTLRRGKPADAMPDYDIPGYSKLGATAPGKDADKPAAAANAKPVQLIPAISDATGPDPHPYGFSWLKDEEGERREQMITLAKEKVRAYVQARAKARIQPVSTQGAHHASGAKSSATSSSAKSASAKVQDPILENVMMPAFDLWGGNQPVMVFSADAHMPTPPAGSAFSGVDAELHYSVVLIAYPDIYNNIHPIYVGVTDKYHLDLTPRLELIDAVDADGDLRGELLFREISDAGTGWIIYRATADKLWTMFDSLHAE